MRQLRGSLAMEYVYRKYSFVLSVILISFSFISHIVRKSFSLIEAAIIYSLFVYVLCLSLRVHLKSHDD